MRSPLPRSRHLAEGGRDVSLQDCSHGYVSRSGARQAWAAAGAADVRLGVSIIPPHPNARESGRSPHRFVTGGKRVTATVLIAGEIRRHSLMRHWFAGSGIAVGARFPSLGVGEPLAGLPSRGSSLKMP
jgi:hypothetical protein